MSARTRSRGSAPKRTTQSAMGERGPKREVTPNAALDRLSRRLWAVPKRTPKQERAPTVGSLIRADEAQAFVRLLRSYASKAGSVTKRKIAGELKGAPPELAGESAAFLITGVLALGSSGLGDEGRPLFDALLQGAFGTDALSQNLRDATLKGLGDWPDFPDGGPPFPPIGDDCLSRMASSAARAGRFVQTAAAGNAFASVDANGITSLAPNRGSADDIVRILGAFPNAQPAGRTVLFPRAGGGTLAAQLTGVGWTANVIEVVVPEPPGDGPVGFGTASDEAGGADPTAVIEFSESLVSCLGARAAGLAGRLNGLAPGATLTVRQPIPTLPNDANVFHGGPVLSRVSATGGTELDPAFTVTGLNLQNGDTVYLDNVSCTTTFVSATQLRFRVPAIVSGPKLLRIGRQHHRSNGTAFEVRATLNTTPPAGRVTPDTYARLSGTGFGAGITATVDGRSTRVAVSDTHTLEVLVNRPARQPLPSEKTGEPVTVEVFDRYVSLGTVRVTIDTFRIAAFGDSIVWGQGVLPAQRFPMLIADVISARRNNRIAVFALDHCARSGAIISTFSLEPTNTAVPRGPTVFTGECFLPTESITNQVRAWTADPTLNSERPQIDLVILDGGINDVGVGTILDPFGSDTALAAATLSLYSTGGAFDTLLTSVMATFPSARIVVTGYYPIVSNQTNLEFLIPLLAHLGLLVGFATSLVAGVVVAIVPGAPIGPIGFGPIASAVFKAWLQGRLSTRSATFSVTANAALSTLVATTAAANPTRRLAFALPAFGPQNAIFAPDAFLYGVTASLGPEDPVAAARAAACPVAPGIGGIPTLIASIGHPNAKGAQAYADAIAAVLPSLGL